MFHFHNCLKLVIEILLNQVGPDAAIIFSDILVVLQAMGIKVEMKDNIGPWINSPIRKNDDIKKVRVPEVKAELINNLI